MTNTHSNQRSEISAAIIAASQSLDFRRYDEFADWLDESCELMRPTSDESLRGRDAIVAAYRRTPENRVNRHVISNIQVTPESEDKASAVSYVTLYSTEDGDATNQPTGAPVHRCLVGEFHDTWKLSANSEWRLLHRRAAFIFQLPLPEAST